MKLAFDLNSHIDSILDGLLASFIYFLITVLILFAVIIFPKYRRWYNYLKFIGVDRKNSKIEIYVSNLQIQPKGTRGVGDDHEQPERGYTGPAITENEYKAALLLQDEIRRHRALFFPKQIRDYFLKPKLVYGTVEASIGVSPPFTTYEESKSIYRSKSDAKTSPNIVLIGSDIYNLLSYEFMNQKKSMIKFQRDKKDEKRTISIYIRDKSGMSWQWEKERIKETQSGKPQCELGIIQRLQNKNGSRITLCAGTSSASTHATVAFLFNNWKHINKQLTYPDNNFSFYLEFNDISDNREKRFEDEFIDGLSTDKFKQERPNS